MIKRFVIITVSVIAVLLCAGRLCQSPPSVVDVISGATPKAHKNEVTKLEGSYIFGINADCFDDESKMKVFFDTAQNIDSVKLADNVSLKVYIPENEKALCSYAKRLDEKLDGYNCDIDIMTFSEVMVYSKVISGRYESFLIPADVLNEQELENMYYVLLDSRDMR